MRLSHILAQIPAFGGAEPVIAPLSGGITNENFRVDVGGEAFVVRIGGGDTHLLGIDRQHEYICSTIAADLGVGAEVVQFLSREGVLVTRFIQGASLSPEDGAKPEIMARIVASIRRCHEGPAFPGRFSPFAAVRSYHRLSTERGVSFPATLPRALALMAQIEEALGPPPLLCPCHNDLLAQNFIDDGETIRILDWEYAGMGDIFFDLGNFAANHELDQEGSGELLRAYFGQVRSGDLSRLLLMRLSSDLRESFWGFLQAGISKLDVDYPGYAQKHLDRFLQHAETPAFDGRLREAAAPRGE
jgi:thiamine kinase-like enzyme